MTALTRNFSRTAHRTSTFTRAVKFVGGVVGPRQVTVVASDATLDRQGDILEPAGARLDEFRRNPIILAQHDYREPIARCSSIGLRGNQLVATIEFPEPGVSTRADEYLRLIKAGIVSAVSVGFIPLKWEPLRDAGLRYTDWELVELSVVSVPANPAALVLERAFGADTLQGRLRRADELRRGVVRRGYFDTREDRVARAHALRERFMVEEIDPQIIVADAAFRLRAG